MDGWLLAGLVYQVLNALWLAFLLAGSYRRSRHHTYLKYWALAWVSLAVVMAGTAPFRLAGGNLSPSLVVIAVISAAVGMAEPVFLGMAAISLGGREVSRAWRMGLPLLVVTLAIAVFAAAATLLPDRVGASAAIRVARAASAGAAAAWFAVTFLRHHPGAATLGGRLTVTCTGLYALYSMALVWATVGAGRQVYEVDNLPWIAGMLALGITSGLLLLLIDEKDAAARAVQAAAERYRLLVETSPDAITVTDDRGRLVMGNRQAAILFGFAQPGEINGVPFVDLIDTASADGVARGLAAAMVGRTVGLGELQFRRRDGGTFPGELTVVPISGETGTGVIARVIDLTARKAAEDQAARLEARLAQAEKLESIGRLAGGVAHDFNNLLTVINGYGNLLLDELPPGSPQQELARAVCSAGDRAADLTRQLLAFSRRQVLEPSVLSLNEVVAGEQDMLRRLLPESVALDVRLDPGVGTVLADRSQLGQVLMNLVLNARDAVSGRGHIVVETSIVDWDADRLDERPQMTPGRYAMLAVTDNGHGMDDKTRQQVFEPFFTTKAKGQGTGLGLASVYGIVRQSGGWIWVYSEPDRGTTFKVYLPAVDGIAEQVRANEAPCDAAGRTGTVLVVEDQADVRVLAATALQQAGYTVLAAASGEEGLAIAARTDGVIDLVFTDVVMPGISGREMAGRIAESRPGVRILYTSGYTGNVIVHEGVLDPHVAYLPKPFTPRQLVERVRAVMAR